MGSPAVRPERVLAARPRGRGERAPVCAPRARLHGVQPAGRRLADRQVPARRAVPRRVADDAASRAVRAPRARRRLRRARGAPRPRAERGVEPATLALAWVLGEPRSRGRRRARGGRSTSTAVPRRRSQLVGAANATSWAGSSPGDSGPRPRRRRAAAADGRVHRGDGDRPRRPRARRGLPAAACRSCPRSRAVDGPDARAPRRRASAVYRLKAVCIFPEQRRPRPRPAPGHRHALRRRDRRVRAILDASAITAIRTAAVSARGDAAAGARGRAARWRSSARASRRAPTSGDAEARAVRATCASGAGPERAAARRRGAGAVPVEAVETAEEAVRGADVVVHRHVVARAGRAARVAGRRARTSTRSARRIPTTRELDGATVAAAALFVRPPRVVVNEAGDYLLAVEEAAHRPRPHPRRARRGARPARGPAGRSRDEITRVRVARPGGRGPRRGRATSTAVPEARASARRSSFDRDRGDRRRPRADRGRGRAHAARPARAAGQPAPRSG